MLNEVVFFEILFLVSIRLTVSSIPVVILLEVELYDCWNTVLKCSIGESSIVLRLRNIERSSTIWESK